MSRRKIKAIFIDMDGTLVYFPNGFSPAQFLLKVLRKLGFSVELGEVEQVYRDAETWWKERFADDFTRWTREYFVEYNRRILSHLGLMQEDGSLTAFAKRIQDHWERAPEEAGELLYPEAPAVLEELKARELALGILSNRTLSTIRSSLQKHGISNYFSFLVSPQVANAPRGKLDRAMWTYALERAGAKPEEVVHIGDRYDHDVLGARAVGVPAILIDREDRCPDADCPRARDLQEAVSLLEGWVL